MLHSRTSTNTFISRRIWDYVKTRQWVATDYERKRVDLRPCRPEYATVHDKPQLTPDTTIPLSTMPLLL